MGKEVYNRLLDALRVGREEYQKRLVEQHRSVALEGFDEALSAVEKWIRDQNGDCFTRAELRAWALKMDELVRSERDAHGYNDKYSIGESRAVGNFRNTFKL